ncbi:hypothetical protein B0H66DRAFT_539164 [Apodospora peruviana]|uniref:Uncharacterized protein n=1 Tax=Apodospora peruviana TaxID=516989 RepID=A0AAE0HRU2_9PEZI|nr:hypothetical protein B0H66DRAFT_539164 [Apodospora peruviana]
MVLQRRLRASQSCSTHRYLRVPMQCSRFMSAAPLPGQESNSEQIRCGIGKTSNPFLGQIIVIDCSMTETTTLTTSTINTTPLQPYSISERKPSGQSCTIASVLAPRWTIHVGSLSMVTNWYALGSGYDSLRMRAYVDMHVSSYADKTIYVHADSREMVPFRTETDPGKWYPCTDVGWRPERIDCSWQMDFVNGYLALNHSWVCSDKDPENPILFTAVGEARSSQPSCEYSYSHNNNGSSIHCDGVLKGRADCLSYFHHEQFHHWFQLDTYKGK